MSTTVTTFKGYRQIFCLLMLMCLSACAGIGSEAEKAAVSGPRFSLDERVYNFGYAGPGMQVRHTFHFKNIGNEKLVISDVKSDCGCIAVLLSGKEIRPREGGSVQASFETREYEGEQKKNIIISSNDTQEGEIVLTLSGTIKRGTVVVPQGINLGDITRGENAAGKVRLLQLSNERLVISKIDAGKFLTANVLRFRDENSSGYEIEIGLSGDLPVGPFTDVVTLHTNLQQQPRIDVPVWANIIH